MEPYNPLWLTETCVFRGMMALVGGASLDAGVVITHYSALCRSGDGVCFWCRLLGSARNDVLPKLLYLIPYKPYKQA